MQTQEEINDLTMKARNGDREALLQLWQGVSRLAYKFAMRYQSIAALNGAVDVDDLKQCAFLGFYAAGQAIKKAPIGAGAVAIFTGLLWCHRGVL